MMNLHAQMREEMASSCYLIIPFPENIIEQFTENTCAFEFRFSSKYPLPLSSWIYFNLNIKISVLSLSLKLTKYKQLSTLWIVTVLNLIYIKVLINKLKNSYKCSTNSVPLTLVLHFIHKLYQEMSLLDFSLLGLKR